MTTTPPSLNICIFASGSGTNAAAIMQAISSEQLHATIGLIVTDRSEASILHRAKEHNIPTSVLPPSDFKIPAEYEQRLLTLMDSHEINFIVLAGYLKKIPERVVDEFQERMTNIHPSLLPSFGGPGMYGIRVHKAALERGVRWTGATVHFVDHTYDTGPIILQKIVPVHQNDTPNTLAARVLTAEHQLYPEALQLIAEGRVLVQNHRVTIKPQIPH